MTPPTPGPAPGGAFSGGPVTAATSWLEHWANGVRARPRRPKAHGGPVGCSIQAHPGAGHCPTRVRSEEMGQYQRRPLRVNNSQGGQLPRPASCQCTAGTLHICPPSSPTLLAPSADNWRVGEVPKEAWGRRQAPLGTASVPIFTSTQGGLGLITGPI